MTATRYRVTAPNPEYSGATGDCQFNKGVYVGEVADGTRLYFEQAGYHVHLLEGDAEIDGVEGSLLDPVDPAELKGSALDRALEAAGLPSDGTVEDKRDRLTQFAASYAEDPGEQTGGPDLPPAEDLKGQALADALDQAGLSKDGTADEKRARLAAFQAGQAAGSDTTQNGA
jgi:hypothetical protein